MRSLLPVDPHGRDRRTDEQFHDLHDRRRMSGRRQSAAWISHELQSVLNIRQEQHGPDIPFRHRRRCHEC